MTKLRNHHRKWAYQVMSDFRGGELGGHSVQPTGIQEGTWQDTNERT